MRLSHLIFIPVVLIFGACHSGNDLFDIMPGSDIAALEGMHDAYEEAKFYNESLERCATASTPCDTETVTNYDEFFHKFDEMFDHQHNLYSHNNVGDDHHHENGNMEHHGMMDDHPDYVHNAAEHEYEHNAETFELMVEMRKMHELIHPG